MPDCRYRFKTVVSGQSGITCLLSGVGAEAVLDGNLAIVKDNPFGDTAEVQEWVQLSGHILQHRPQCSAF